MMRRKLAIWGEVFLTLTPKKVQIPSKNTLLMQGMYFQKEIETNEKLKEGFQKL